MSLKVLALICILKVSFFALREITVRQEVLSVNQVNFYYRYSAYSFAFINLNNEIKNESK